MSDANLAYSADKNANMKSTMEILSLLEGRWTGEGSGVYPTIEPFEYRETLCFETNQKNSLLHYEQRADVLDPTRDGHWESGFVRPLASGLVQISNSQNSGRVEVLEGEIGINEKVVRLELKSLLLDNDPRMVQTRRIFEIVGDTLTYQVDMATRTTKVPEIQIHLSATLLRS